MEGVTEEEVRDRISMEDEVAGGEAEEWRKEELPSVVEDSEEEEEPQLMSQHAIAIFMQATASGFKQEQQEGVASFLTARALLAENFMRRDVFLSPGFRSMAAMAGWDDESLLMATEEDENGAVSKSGKNEKSSSSSSLSISAATVDQSPQASLIRRDNRERKREERTPQQAVTPLSAGRRHRRPRRQTIHGCLPEALPIGDLSLNEEFQKGATQPSEEGSKTGKKEEDFTPPDIETASFPQAPQPETPASPKSPQPETHACPEAPQPQPETHASLEAPEPAAFLQAPQTQPQTHASPQAPQPTTMVETGARSANPSNPAKTAEPASSNQKPGCLDQLREELSCAVCLDICFEPSTTSCGHSFCRGCLQSVLEKCGPRCPKCRQQLRGDTWRSCPVNVVLWNTVQLLFPGEAAARAASAKEMGDQVVVVASQRPRIRQEAGTRGGGEAWQNARPPVAGLRRRGANNGASGRRVFVASRREELLVGSVREEEGGDRPALLPRSFGSSSRGSSSHSQRRRQQEESDALFARRLQQAELMGSSSSSSSSSRALTSSSSSTTVANAAANLRSVAYHAIRQSFRSRY